MRTSRPNKIKVLHVCETIQGGVATYLNTFEEVCGRDFDDFRIIPENHSNHLSSSERVVTYKRGRRGLKGLINLLRASHKTVRGYKPDFIFFHSTFSAAVMPLFRLIGIPGIYIYCPHAWARLAYLERPRIGRLFSTIEGWLSGFSDAVLNISNNDNALAAKYGYRGAHFVIENALPDLPNKEITPPYALIDGQINLLFVGRFDRQKGLDILIEAFKTSAQANPSLHLHVVGAALYGVSPEAGGLGSARITFHSWVPFNQIPAYFSSADLVVMPSRWEGLPMALIEALRAGTPVMVADTSGLGDLVEHGRSGFVIAPNADAFAKALSSLTPRQLKEMRREARLMYERRFSAERFRKEMLEFFGTLYAEQISGTRPSSALSPS